jgi:Na+-transporting NADH:ubiquinone oxidoreductase subunit NqrB
MNPELGAHPGTAAPAAPSTAEAVAAAPATARPRRKLDQRWIAPAFVTLILLAAQITAGVVGWPYIGAAIVTAIVVEAVLGKVFVGKWPHLASAWVSGISVGILLRPTMLWPMALCAAISIASKYVVRWENRHLWNPSNFGICAMLLLAPESVATLSVQFGNHAIANALILCLGAFLVYRLKRLHITLTYVASFFAFAALRSVVLDVPYLTEIGPITGPMYQLYIFFMITDPKTTVTGTRAQMLVAFLVAAAECVLRFAKDTHAPYFALFIVGPIANAVDIWMAKRRAPAPA